MEAQRRHQEEGLRAGDVASSVACCPACTRLWVQFPALCQIGMVVHTPKFISWKVELKVILDYSNFEMRSVLRRENGKRGSGP